MGRFSLARSPPLQVLFGTQFGRVVYGSKICTHLIVTSVPQYWLSDGECYLRRRVAGTPTLEFERIHVTCSGLNFYRTRSHSLSQAITAASHDYLFRRSELSCRNGMSILDHHKVFTGPNCSCRALTFRAQSTDAKTPPRDTYSPTCMMCIPGAPYEHTDFASKEEIALVFASISWYTPVRSVKGFY